MSEYICPKCGSRIDVSTKMKYVYCPVCTEKILSDDLKKGLHEKVLISALTAKESNTVTVDKKRTDEEELRIAAEKGSVDACMVMASQYVLSNNCSKAKKYFQIAANNGIHEARFATLVCDLEENGYTSGFMNLYKRIQEFNQLSFRYLSKETLNELNWIIDYKKRMWDAEHSSSNTEIKSNSSSSYSEPEYQRYIPPVEESTKERSWIMGCGVTGTFWGMGYNS